MVAWQETTVFITPSFPGLRHARTPGEISDTNNTYRAYRAWYFWFSGFWRAVAKGTALAFLLRNSSSSSEPMRKPCGTTCGSLAGAVPGQLKTIFRFSKTPDNGPVFTFFYTPTHATHHSHERSTAPNTRCVTARANGVDLRPPPLLFPSLLYFRSPLPAALALAQFSHHRRRRRRRVSYWKSPLQRTAGPKQQMCLSLLPPSV